MVASILLTGASGYIGGHLLRYLEEGGHAVRCLARHPENVAPFKLTTHVVAGDCLDEASLDRALSGIRCAYYLVHSMASFGKRAGGWTGDLEASECTGDAATPSAAR